MQIEGESQLAVLIKAVWIAKYNSNPEESFEIVASPILADILTRAYDDLIETYRRNGKEHNASIWERQRSAANRKFEVKALYAHIERSETARWWIGTSFEKKTEFIRIFMSPYVVNEDQLAQLISDCNAFASSIAAGTEPP